MYSSSRGGSNTFGQQGQQQQQSSQPYATQSAYRQNLGPSYSGSSVGGQDAASQLSMALRHSSMLGGGGPREAEISGGYRAHPSAAAHYGGQYSSVYGSAALSSTQQVSAAGSKGAAPASLEGRRGYNSAMPESPKLISGDYGVPSSSHGYGQKGDQLFMDKISDYPSIDRRQYGERSSAYMGREQNEPTSRYTDSLGFGHQHQPDLFDRLDPASVLRHEQMLKVQSLQSNTLDGGSRQADYLATRAAAIRHTAEDLLSYGGRIDAEPRSLTLLSGSSHAGQHAPSILGAAPRRNVDDLVYAQNSSNPGYGVSLPPGRDYATGKGLHGASLELDYPGSLVSRGSLSREDDRKNERGGYARELDRREEERRRDLLREREKDRERDKERDRERGRERERERQRKSERIKERRSKERDRELKHSRERTPPRISRDRHGSLLSKEGRSLRRESPRLEISHRRHSPVKEKRREYVCKVYSSNLIDVERDYLSMDKRYPRLFINPECSKVVANWPRENLKLSFHTPVSFEHDFIEEEIAADQKLLPKMSDDESSKSDRGTTLWNAKMILMSGLSQNALEDLSSERTYDDRIPHFCNMLRFALLKRDNALMAIGGPWDKIDGEDPSADESTLVRTVTRYAKDVAGLELKNCSRWNRFLEIHYDRIGKDGLFSHKEVTVLYVPDLSECLPSLEIWRDQWLAHKKEIADRERQLAQIKEKPKEKKEKLKDKDPESKDPKSADKSEKKKASESSGQATEVKNKENDGKKLKSTAAEKVVDENGKKVLKSDAIEVEEGKTLEKKDQEDNPVQTSGIVKSGKKRIIKKRIVKQKVSEKSSGLESATSQSDKLEAGDAGGKNANSEVNDQVEMVSSTPAAVKTFTRKKITKKVQGTKSAQKGDDEVQPEVKSLKEAEGSEDKSKAKSGSSNAAGVQDASVKTTVKKKIIRRVAKRKVSALEANDVTAEGSKDGSKDGSRLAQAENEMKTTGEQTIGASNHGKEVKSANKVLPGTKLKQTSEKQDNADSLSKKANNVVTETEKDEKKIKDCSSIGPKKGTGEGKQKVNQKDGHAGKNEKSSEKEKCKDEKEKKDNDGKDETRSKSNREVKEKKKPEEPPRHPGLFLQTKGTKNSKLRSLSLSLDSLLDYTDKDIEESTFELSLFAETLYEMLQYQMGCRLLTFLQKLRIKFVAKRNKRKRQSEESAKENELASPVKRVKTEEHTVEVKSIKTETKEESQSVVEPQPNAENIAVKENVNSSNNKDEKVKPDDETDEDEDPEEDPEEDEEMQDGSPQHDSANEEKAVGKDIDPNAQSEKDEQQEAAKEATDSKSKTEAETKPEVTSADPKKKETRDVDKELLQAFRFFDRNRVGYIRVEDMRLIIHNLGKFMSHRDVKELVQSALLESNTGRNDQILYNKLVRMSAI